MKPSLFLACVLPLATVTVACSVPDSLATTYRPANLAGGYSEKEVEPGVWRVKGQSNGTARRGFSADMAMHRAAEIMKEKGFKDFQVIDQKGKQRSMSVGGGASTNAGEYFQVWVVGVPVNGVEAECRSDDPFACGIFNVDDVLTKLGPRLGVPR